MQIVKLAHPGEAALEHFGISQRGNREQVIGAELIDKAVHRRAPGPEAVATRAAPLGATRHAALEGVAVEVGQAGNCHGVAQIAGLRRGIGRHPRKAAIRQLHADSARPATGQQGFGKMQAGGHVVPRGAAQTLKSIQASLIVYT